MKFKKIGEYTVILVISFLILFGFEAPNILLIFFPPLFIFRHWHSFSPAAGEPCSELAIGAHDVAAPADRRTAEGCFQSRESPAIPGDGASFKLSIKIATTQNKEKRNGQNGTKTRID